jgi:hypothetical protein
MTVRKNIFVRVIDKINTRLHQAKKDETTVAPGPNACCKPVFTIIHFSLQFFFIDANQHLKISPMKLRHLTSKHVSHMIVEDIWHNSRLSGREIHTLEIAKPYTCIY